MAAAAEMLTGIPATLLVPVFTAIILALLVFASYEAMTGVLKWLTLVLFAYLLAAFLAQPDWGEVLRGTFLPHFEFSERFLLTFVAILGTTISPYLFFWQAAHEVEAGLARAAKRSGQPARSIERELRIARVDVLTGMFVSNLIMYFIILTAGATLHKAGLTDVETAQQAAEALRPLAGNAASLLFTLGLIGTGMLGVPVLAGSSAYAVSEASDWEAGMNHKPRVARNFYAVIVLGMLAGMALNFAHLNAIRMLIWSAVVNGLLAPPLIVIILVVCNNERVMGEHKNGLWLNVLGGLAALLMTGAAVALIWSWFR
jgi:Mn2+/Fe2+ NRAMP family transporter